MRHCPQNHHHHHHRNILHLQYKNSIMEKKHDVIMQRQKQGRGTTERKKKREGSKREINKFEFQRLVKINSNLQFSFFKSIFYGMKLVKVINKIKFAFYHPHLRLLLELCLFEFRNHSSDSSSSSLCPFLSVA